MERDKFDVMRSPMKSVASKYVCLYAALLCISNLLTKGENIVTVFVV